MTTFANVNTTAASMVTSLNSAVANAATIKTNISASGLGSMTLNNLATSTTSWKMNVGELRVELDDAIASLGVAVSRLSDVAVKIGAIASLD